MVAVRREEVSLTSGPLVGAWLWIVYSQPRSHRLAQLRDAQGRRDYSDAAGQSFSFFNFRTSLDPAHWRFSFAQVILPI